jgi:predicted DNA-binding transcriptional regulator AlpA
VTKILRPKQSQERLGCGHTKFYQLIANGRLSKPLRYDGITGHTEEEIDAFIEKLKAARDRGHEAA